MCDCDNRKEKEMRANAVTAPQAPYVQIVNELEERRDVLSRQLNETDAAIRLLRDNPAATTEMLETLQKANVYSRVVPFGY